MTNNTEQNFNQVFKGFWNYALNHARVRYDGEIDICFSISGRDDFEAKLKSRIFDRKGYGVVNATEIYNESVKIRDLYMAHNKLKRFYKLGFWRNLWLKLLLKVGKYAYRKSYFIQYQYMIEKKTGHNPVKSSNQTKPK